MSAMGRSVPAGAVAAVPVLALLWLAPVDVRGTHEDPVDPLTYFLLETNVRPRSGSDFIADISNISLSDCGTRSVTPPSHHDARFGHRWAVVFFALCPPQ